MLFTFSVCLVSTLLNLCKGLEETGAQYSCGNIKSQKEILINQVIGIWFGVEIILHKPDLSVETVRLDVCPIINIEEMEDEVIYETRYGADYDGRESGDQNSYYTTERQRYFNRDEHTHNENRNRNWRQPQYASGYNVNGRRVRRMKRLKLEWDEDNERTTYILSYDNSTLGFWRSGMTMDPRINHFAGGIHVLKAVKGHLVLTFCHVMPERHLYTLILSRYYEGLRPSEIGSIHRLLIEEGLQIRKVKKVCSGGNSVNTYVLNTAGVLMFSLFLQKYLVDFLL